MRRGNRIINNSHAASKHLSLILENWQLTFGVSSVSIEGKIKSAISVAEKERALLIIKYQNNRSEQNNKQPANRGA